MPMTRDKHEELITELLNPELEQSRRTDILQELRVDYGSVLADFDGLTEANTKLQKNNDDLIISNSQLFRQVGIVGNDDKEEIKEKEISETISIEDIERSMN